MYNMPTLSTNGIHGIEITRFICICEDYALKFYKQHFKFSKMQYVSLMVIIILQLEPFYGHKFSQKLKPSEYVKNVKIHVF